MNILKIFTIFPPLVNINENRLGANFEVSYQQSKIVGVGVVKIYFWKHTHSSNSYIKAAIFYYEVFKFGMLYLLLLRNFKTVFKTS